MINKKIIFRALGFLLYVQAGFLILSLGVSIYYGEDDMWAFVISLLMPS